MVFPMHRFVQYVPNPHESASSAPEESYFAADDGYFSAHMRNQVHFKRGNINDCAYSLQENGSEGLHDTIPKQ